MSGKRFNKVNAGIVFLLVLVLVSGGFVIVQLVGGEGCGIDPPAFVIGIITEGGSPVSGASVILSVNGIYKASMLTNTSGIYGLVSDEQSSNASLTIIKDGIINCLDSFTLTCNAQTDIPVNFNSAVQKHDIYISNLYAPESLKEFQTATINASIYNNHSCLMGVDIVFYKNNISDETLISSHTLFIPSHSTGNISASWSVSYGTSGDQTIIAVVDPDNKINETNESNNQANKTINVISNEDFIKQDNVIFNYIYMPDNPKCEKASVYLPQLENIFGNRFIIHESCVYLDCDDNNPMSDLANTARAHTNYCVYFPYTITMGKKSIVNNSIDDDKANYTCNFPEAGKTENQTFNQWIENICYQFEVKPNACLPCDLNNDGIIIKDYRELMDAYKCFLRVKKNCRDLNGNGITFKDWNEMKHEYECFIGGQGLVNRGQGLVQIP
ncbi:hypothetical protein BEH94_03255 [Candidatus Altiarchaeales archaeon WOR_SM1_SCG]|nr:hypothetical protein BEH94_03255 [Candidatus Altiarchaeales archaeon WOR_SM1_SCG]